MIGTQKVYRAKHGRGLYVVDGVGQRVGLDGRRYFTLEPANRLFDATTKLPVPDDQLDRGDYRQLHEALAFCIVVSQEELESEFDLEHSLLAVQNEPIEALLAHYESERCNHQNLGWVARTAQRYVLTMEDSQVRCLLHVLAEHVAASLPVNEVELVQGEESGVTG